jgi:hypothetical protein
MKVPPVPGGRSGGRGGGGGGTENGRSVNWAFIRLAYRGGKLLRVPPIEKLKEAAPRRGFFERDQYEAVRRHLRPDLQVVAAIEYAFGWRAQSEVLPLEVRQLDLAAGTLRLDVGQTKNDDAAWSTSRRSSRRCWAPRWRACRRSGRSRSGCDEGDGPPHTRIVSPADPQDAARRLAGTFQGTSGVAEVDRPALTSENHGTRL